MGEERAAERTINCLSRHRLGEEEPEFVRLYLNWCIAFEIANEFFLRTLGSWIICNAFVVFVIVSKYVLAHVHLYLATIVGLIISFPIPPRHMKLINLDV